MSGKHRQPAGPPPPRPEGAVVAGLTALMNPQHVKQGANLLAAENAVRGRVPPGGRPAPQRPRPPPSSGADPDRDPAAAYAAELERIAAELGVDVGDGDAASSSGAGAGRAPPPFAARQHRGGRDDDASPPAVRLAGARAVAAPPPPLVLGGRKGARGGGRRAPPASDSGSSAASGSTASRYSGSGSGSESGSSYSGSGSGSSYSESGSGYSDSESGSYSESGSGSSYSGSSGGGSSGSGSSSGGSSAGPSRRRPSRRRDDAQVDAIIGKLGRDLGIGSGRGGSGGGGSGGSSSSGDSSSSSEEEGRRHHRSSHHHHSSSHRHGGGEEDPGARSASRVMEDLRGETRTAQGAERAREKELRDSKLEQIGQLRLVLEEEGISCGSVADPGPESSMEEVDSVLNTLRLKNDRNRYSSLAEELILGAAQVVETVFDGQRVVPVLGLRPDYTGYSATVNAKLHRMRFETSQVVGDIINRHNVGPTMRIVMELLPGFFLYPKTQSYQRRAPGLGDAGARDMRGDLAAIRAADVPKSFDDVRAL